MSNKDRNRLRKLQDKLLALPQTKKFAEQFGDDYPVFEGGPSVRDLRAFVCPAHEQRLQGLLADMKK